VRGGNRRSNHTSGRPMRKGTRRLIITAVVLLPIAVAFCFWAVVDSPPPDDADLGITREIIPDEENAFTYFNRAAENLDWPKDHEGREHLERLLEQDGWDEGLASDILARNEGLFDLIARGLACDRFQVPEIQGPHTPLPYLHPWRSIGQLGVIRAESLFRQGREEVAFQDAMQILRFGDRIETGPAPTVVYWFGSELKLRGLTQLRNMLSRASLTSTTLAGYVRALEGWDVPPDALDEALRVDYQLDCAGVDSLATGRLSLRDFPCSRPLPSGHLMLLKPNKTKRMLARGYRALLTNIRQPYCRATLSEIPDLFDTLVAARAHASGNGKGWIYCAITVPPARLLQEYKCRERCAVAATRILIALKCYKLEHGELPETLDALVPEYFEAVPLDDFDGKPMKYSRDKRVVYAVGTDLTDNGGIAEDGREDILPRDGYDLIYKIEF
jgi:hypothetical protein